MKARFVSAAQFAAAARLGDGDDLGIETANTTAPATAGARRLRYRVSDSSIGRDNYRIMPGAWDFTNYRKNPTWLFAHLDTEPPIARTVDIGELAGGVVLATAEFIDPAVYSFAGTVFEMARSGFLNACSVRWLPISWQYSTDKSRPSGGIDFTAVELLEISVVPVPGLPSALLEERARRLGAPLAHRTMIRSAGRAERERRMRQATDECLRRGISVRS